MTETTTSFKERLKNIKGKYLTFSNGEWREMLHVDVGFDGQTIVFRDKLGAEWHYDEDSEFDVVDEIPKSKHELCAEEMQSLVKETYGMNVQTAAVVELLKKHFPEGGEHDS